MSKKNYGGGVENPRHASVKKNGIDICLRV